MSSNQRPTKVRVFSSQNSSPVPNRRRTDVQTETEAPQTATPAVQTAAAPTAGRGSTLMLLMLFLIGCAIGGAVLTLIGLG